MNFCRQLSILALSVVIGICLVSCEKKKQGKVVIAEQEFTMQEDKENTFRIDARGKIRNVGEVDVKNVVVTGYCRSCGEEWIPGKWFVSSDAEKLPEQKAVINFLPAGGESEFSFMRVADMLLTAGQSPPELPEKMEVVIESFEIVE